MTARRIRGAAAIALLAFTASGCAALPPACVAPGRLMANAELVFGRNIGPRTAVSEADFAAFVAAQITPRFPDGLTVIDAKGQWRDPRGLLVREPSKVVLLVFDDDPDRRAGLDAIAQAYKRTFRQQSVLVSVRTACVSLWILGAIDAAPASVAPWLVPARAGRRIARYVVDA